MAPIKKLVNTNIGALALGYVDVEAQWACFKGAISRRVHSFGTFCLLAILYFKICEIRRHVLNKHVEAVVLSPFGPYPSPQAQNMDKNVFLDFYIAKSVPGHSWSILPTPEMDMIKGIECHMAFKLDYLQLHFASKFLQILVFIPVGANYLLLPKPKSGPGKFHS